MLQKMQSTKKRNIGQGMTEYIIIVALIAVAAIGVYSFFGQTLRHQMAALSDEMSGTSASDQIAKGQTAAGSAGDVAETKVNLGDYDKNATTSTQ